MAELWLVCEGEPTSIDVNVLREVFAKVLPSGIVVEPACGSSPSVVARFLELRRGGRAAFVHDRDYRARKEAEEALKDGTPGFLLRRHSIENYLLEPRVIACAFRRLRERYRYQSGRVPPWLSAMALDAGEIGDALMGCARRRSAKEACRLATERLWTSLPPPLGYFQKRYPPAPEAPGHPQACEWREAMCQEIESLRTIATQTAECQQLQRDAVVQLFDTAYAEVAAEAYIGGLEFLVDYHGRELLRDLLQWLRDQGARLSDDAFLKELIAALVVEYQEDRNLFGRDDFLDLANAVRSLAGWAPVT